jgi:hypothetical protein
VRERLTQLQKDMQPSAEDAGITANEAAPSRESAFVEAEQPQANKDQSPLEVMQRWLSAIKQGRANV